MTPFHSLWVRYTLFWDHFGSIYHLKGSTEGHNLKAGVNSFNDVDYKVSCNTEFNFKVIQALTLTYYGPHLATPWIIGISIQVLLIVDLHSISWVAEYIFEVIWPTAKILSSNEFLHLNLASFRVGKRTGKKSWYKCHLNNIHIIFCQNLSSSFSPKRHNFEFSVRVILQY